MPLIFDDPIDFDFMCRAIGLIGFSLYVIGFFLLSTGRLDSRRPVYFKLTLIAASCLLVSLSVDFNLSAAMIQLFYVLMSLGAIAKRRARAFGPSGDGRDHATLYRKG
ncbi:MAG: hypothetical protein AAF484_08080 [Pseudomonadota bacterium]